jgi:hypothetical protein
MERLKNLRETLQFCAVRPFSASSNTPYKKKVGISKQPSKKAHFCVTVHELVLIKYLTLIHVPNSVLCLFLAILSLLTRLQQLKNENFSNNSTLPDRRFTVEVNLTI